MYKRLLVPVDFSDCSRNALMHAVLLSAHFDAQLDVMRAFDVPAYMPPEALLVMGHVSAPWLDFAEQRAREELSTFVTERARQLRPNRQIVVAGSPANAIVQLAAEEDYDLIVMGTHGRSGFSHLVLGSTAERVVRAAPCPVLTVRPEPTR
jgi:universal stress protein A